MKHTELRAKFKQFFESRGHVWVASAPLLPKDDPSVLFTVAGMQQFKPYFVGVKDVQRDFHSDKTVSIQKCFRTADIDDVGDNTHLTFFEMLGHFAFGNAVSKKEAIDLAWEFLTDTQWMGIDPTRISATYYNGNRVGTSADTESQAALEGLSGLTQISAHPDSDNFWGPTGDEGPCGPNVEFYVDGVEVWNSVFNEFYCHPDQSLTPSPTGLGVDMGTGFERLLVAVNKMTHLFETDVLSPLIGMLSALPEKSQRIIADHIRGTVFLMADHVRPSNKEEGYVLRRILRRLLIHLRNSGVALEDLIDKVIEIFGSVYPELLQEQDHIKQFAREEADKFSRTLDAGENELNKLLTKTSRLDGETAFMLFSTYGLPIDFIKEKATVDEKGFDTAFAKHQAISRAGVEAKFGGHGLAAGATISEADTAKITRLHTATHLLHKALKTILGEDIHQAGSDINPERARFDFNFERKLTDAEIKSVEDWVNDKIRCGFQVTKDTLPYDEAIAKGAYAFFKEKYPDMVDVYTIYNGNSGEVISQELCGGPHVADSSQLGTFKIIKEQSSSAGIRRIKAVLE
ncbi:MAG: alanine--tRNA ligase-related protein [Patescibacteria group bacterium]|nr:alanine--tRNA ligase-related protein [Patescibacteria group bacterium]